jgi:hypothetical protein
MMKNGIVYHKEMTGIAQMHKQLYDHGLKGLSAVLVETGSFIAGSYAIPSFKMLTGGNPDNLPDDRDVDIWLPEIDQRTQTKNLATLTNFLVGAGYNWPQTITMRGKDMPSTYRRLNTSIYRMYLFYGPGLLDVQVLCLREGVGDDPAEIVRDFDMTMLQRWYDGKEIQSTTLGKNALVERMLTVNIDSRDVRTQTFGEWIRTLKRLIKYQDRQFQVTWTDEMTRVVRESASKHILLDGLQLWLLRRWNECVRQLDANLPYLVVTTLPPACRIEHLRVGTTMDGRFVIDSISPMLHWNELTQQEQQDTLSIVHMFSGTNPLARRVKVHGGAKGAPVEDHRVSTLVPFPTFERRTSTYKIASTTNVYVVKLAESMAAEEFLKMNQKDNIIVVDPKGNMNGFSRSRMIQSKTYMACTNVGNMQEMGAISTRGRRGAIAQVPLGEYTIYVPQKQLLAAMGSSDIYFGVQEKDGHFDATISQDTLDGNANFVSADYCQEGSDKPIWRIFGIDTDQDIME